MSDPTDPMLSRAVAALREPVAFADGFADRVASRAVYVRRQRALGAFGAGVGVITALALIVLKRDARQQITFSLPATAAAQSVSLVGDFTEWQDDRIALERTTQGDWRVTVRLRPGQYRYAYVVDHAEWRADAHTAPAPDDFGRPTSLMTVSK